MRGELARLEAAAGRYMRSKWWARAVETYEELVRLAPHENGYRVSLAGAYLKMNRKLDAVRIYTSLLVPESREPTSRLMEYQREILAIDPANTESYILFGDILVSRKLFQDAKSQYLLAVRQFEKRGTFGKAADTLRRIEELDPKNPYIKIHLANIHYKKGDTKDAVSCLGAAAGLLKESGSTEDARMVLGEILALDPKNRDAAAELERLGGETARVEEHRDAAQREEQYAEEPKDPETFFRRADEALAAGDAAKAAGTLERAASLYPGDPRVKIRLGEVYEKRRMIEDAVQAFWEAVVILRESGETDDARELLVRLLALDPGHTEAQMALAKIEVDRSKRGPETREAPPAPESGGREPCDLLARMLGMGAGEGGAATTPDNAESRESCDLESLFGPRSETPGEQDPVFHYQRGLAYLELGLLSEALDELEVAAELPERAADAYQLMGICYKNKGMLKSALGCFEKGLSAAIRQKDGGLHLIEDLERLVDETSHEIRGGGLQ